MKKKLLKFLFILLLIFCFVLSACTQSLHPFDVNGVDLTPSRTFKIYVCGAIEHEGFVEVLEGATIDSVIISAGIIPQTVYPTDSQRLVTQNDKILNISYYDGQSYRYCVNLNSMQIQYRFPLDGIDDVVINEIADYLESNGKITNREMLKDILGDDYQDNYYKFYVDVTDYEEIS